MTMVGVVVLKAADEPAAETPKLPLVEPPTETLTETVDVALTVGNWALLAPA